MQALNTKVFDQSALHWGSAIDRSIRKGRYLRGELFVNAVVDHVKPNSLVLDYGCGPGRISLMLARRGFRVLGVDPSPGMIATARQQGVDTLDVEFRVCPASPNDRSEASYAAIVCSSVIEYVPEPEQLLRWFSAELRPSGLLIISFANIHSIWGAWCRLRHASGFRTARHHMWSWPQFRRLLERCSFAPEDDPVYFESPLDRLAKLRLLLDSSLGGTLGLVVACRCAQVRY